MVILTDPNLDRIGRLGSSRHSDPVAKYGRSYFSKYLPNRRTFRHKGNYTLFQLNYHKTNLFKSVEIVKDALNSTCIQLKLKFPYKTIPLLRF